MQAHSLSAVVFTSPDPARLAAFYSRHLGLGFAAHRHDDGPEHQEARLGDMRFAVVPGPTLEPVGRSGVSPTFLVNGLDAFVEALGADGVELRAPIRTLGPGRRLALFQDIDGNGFQLLDLGFTV